MNAQAETIVRVLTITALAGLLGTVGLRLTLGQVVRALRQSRFLLILLVNFLVVPALAVAAARVFELQRATAIGMILLAAAPCAPVVPIFARMARADLALAAGLTSVFPFLSAVLTPLVCEATLRAVPDAGNVQFRMLNVLAILLATIILPLGAGVALNHGRPALARRVLRPVEMFSEAVGAFSLIFVIAMEFRSVVATGWVPLLAMALVSELSLLAGYACGRPDAGARIVTGLGTSNRNIALAVLIALGDFRGTPVVAAVVANGVLLILLGLLHVAWWRWRAWKRAPAGWNA